jgi:hypothetical protein
MDNNRHGRRLGGDIESNGLLRPSGGIPAMTKVHMMSAMDMDTVEPFYFGPPVAKDHPVWDMPENQGREDISELLANPTGPVSKGYQFFADASLTVFHNGCDFDYRALRRFGPKDIDWSQVVQRDTYVAAKLVWPYDVLMGPDYERAKRGEMPMRLLKSHSLKAWGYRLGENKDDYQGDYDKFPIEYDEAGKDINAEERYARRWEEWNPYMAVYGMQDIPPMIKLWKMIEQRIGWVDPKPGQLVWSPFTFEYEHEYATILAEQQEFGIRIDMDKLVALEADLKNTRAKIEKKLYETFGDFWLGGKVVTPGANRNVFRKDLPDVTIPRVSEKTGKTLEPYVGPPMERYSTDGPYTPITRVRYNPSSREHLALRLQGVFGWKPKKFGSTGKPTVDESVLEEIPEAVLPKDIRQLILDYFVVNKTLGMVAQGTQAWANKVEVDGRIHGRMDSAGAVTRRTTHSSPNLSQVPSIAHKKIVHDDGTKEEITLYGLAGRYGYECRALFAADEGWELTGVDATALELITLGHYLVPFDSGAFRDRVCDPSRDPHQEHADLIYSVSKFAITRSDTKTATYLYIYGGSAYKLSLAVTVEEDEIVDLLQYRGLPMLLRSLAKRFDDDFVAKLDDAQKARIVKARKIIVGFEEGIPGIKDLKEGISGAAEKGWLKGMDGSKLHVRKAHAALNTILQSAGAMICKIWKVLMHRKMRALGFIHGVDYKQLLDVHDEVQWTHKPGLGPIIIKIALDAIKEAGALLGLRGVCRTAGVTGLNWAETH